jgi:hypothetical protein
MPQDDAAVAKEKAKRDAILADILKNFDERAEYMRASTLMQRRIETPYLKAVSAVNREKMAAFQNRIRSLGDEAFAGFNHPSYYGELDVAQSLQRKAKYVAELRLDISSPLRILDLSTSGGHFPFMATQYGHEVIGIDIDLPGNALVLEMYGIKQIVHSILPNAPLPVAGKFHLITALFPMFNRHGGREPKHKFWDVGDWLQFITYLSTLLNYRGRIFLQLNRYYLNGRQDVTDDLMDLFDAKNEAHVNYMNRTILLTLDGPISLPK